MPPSILLVVPVVALVGVAAALVLGGPGRRREGGALLACALSAALATWALAPPVEPPLDGFRPADATQGQRPTYASSSSCRSCHPGEYASWRQTYHRTMTQPASPETIRGDFTVASFTREGRTYRAWREGDRFFADMPAFGTTGQAPDERWVRPIVMTTGFHHMQAYWVPMAADLTGLEARGHASYLARCARCHGESGQGTPRGKPLAGVELQPDELRPFLADETLSHAAPGAASPGDTTGQPAKDSAPLDVAPLDGESQRALLAYLSRLQFDGRLTQFPFVWLVQGQRWVHEDDSFLQPAAPAVDVEPPGDRWGYNCDECHSVAPAFTSQEGELSSTSAAVDLGIACEACHGPGKAHVVRHRSPVERYAPTPVADDIVNPSHLGPRAAGQVCGQCHAEVERKRSGYAAYVPGGELEDDVHIVRHPQGEPPPKWLASALEEDPDRLRGSFWADGTARVAGRDYNGMIESACYQKGSLTCVSCHQMHGSDPDAQLKAGMAGDAACTECHAREASAGEAHTHHPPSSEGARCMSCHMPFTTYGLLQVMRAHRIDSPDPVRSASTGRPDACNLCHLDESLGWTEAHLAGWAGRPPRALPEEAQRLPLAAQLLLEGDAVQRAVVSWHLAWPPAAKASGSGWAAPFLLPLLEDDYAAVRFLAGRALQAQPGFADLSYDFVASPEERRAALEGARLRVDEATRVRAAALLLTEVATLDATVAARRSEAPDPEVLINE